MRLFTLLAVFLCVAAGPSWAQGTPAASLVRPDGTLDLAGAPAGAVNLAGINVTLGADGALRAAAEGDYRDISTGPSGPPFNGAVSALAVAPDGSVYAGGSFTTAGGTVASRVARWTGAAWEPLGAGVNGGVLALAIAADGSVYAGGFFTTAGGALASNIARWTGTAWEPLGTGVGSAVYALAVAADGSVYAGGIFTTAGGALASNIARWTGAAWEPLGAGVNGGVLALAAAGDGSVYVGGNFTTAGGGVASHVARWTGAAWQRVGTGVNNPVYALAVAEDRSVYAGGIFTTAGGAVVSHVARWTGAVWEPLGAGVNAGPNGTGNPAVRALAIAADGSVYVGGFFTTAGGVAANNVARWTGTAWQSLGSGTNGDVYALAVDRQADIVLGGVFAVAGGVTSPFVTLYDAPRPVASDGGAPEGDRLALGVSPNPVTSGGSVRVTVAEAGPARVAVYDVLGRQVAVLADGAWSAGEHVVGLGAERLVPGVYVVRVTAGAASVVRRVTVVR